jgi:hypothetical protein
MSENNEAVDEVINPELDTIIPEVTEESILEPQLTEKTEEKRELTEEEKHDFFIQQLKESKIKFRPTHFKRNVEKKTTITQPFGGSYHRKKVEKIVTYNKSVVISQFDAEYKKKRKNKNKIAKISRKANRK